MKIQREFEYFSHFKILPVLDRVSRSITPIECKHTIAAPCSANRLFFSLKNECSYFVLYNSMF